MMADDNFDPSAILHQMADWGYHLLPPAHPHSPGYTGLLVAFRPQPTRVHYDPESLHLRLRQDNLADWETLTIDSPLHPSQQVCPGPVTLRDRLDKRVDFFTFGGTLTVEADPGEVVYLLESPAPVLELTPSEDDLGRLLAVEVEMMLSVFQARWGADDRGFLERLAQLEPFQFYTASLESILMRYERSHALKEGNHHLFTALSREKEWLIETGQWPIQPQTLGKLFEV
ncbi:MAG: hypothetical protein U0401_12215 [Anaerolineae bacterium]